LNFFQNNGKLVIVKMIQNDPKWSKMREKDEWVRTRVLTFCCHRSRVRSSPETAGKWPQCRPQIPFLRRTGPAFPEPSLSRSLPGISRTPRILCQKNKGPTKVHSRCFWCW
jgi:hypothetical protein